MLLIARSLQKIHTKTLVIRTDSVSGTEEVLEEAKSGLIAPQAVFGSVIGGGA
jgi:glycosyltransferase A (GT-A) superfamily protein (DUF2064 family)